MKKYFYKVLSTLLVLSILLSQNFSSFAYTNNIRYNYFVNSSGQQISEYEIIKALQNTENIEFYDNNSYEKDEFTLNALENKLNSKNVYKYEIRPTAIPAIYAVYTIVVLGVTYTLTIYNNGEILIKAGQKVIDAASAAGRAVMRAAKNLIDNALKKIEENKKSEESKKRVNDVLRKKKKERTTSGNTDIYSDPNKGGLPAAEQDFNRMNQGATRTYPNGTKVGQLPDGTSINVRSKSSDGRPTIEIQRKKGNTIKIRY